MNNHSHSLVVFFHHGFLIEREEERLYKIVLETESPEQFCIAHELLDRNRITSNKKKIIKESRLVELRPFRFLINKN
jgi:hypothetical protein